MIDPVIRFLEKAKSNPDHPAVVHEAESITYGELGSRAARIASSISSRHENPRVLIYLPKGADAYAAMFGTLMAGGYYSPINIDAPAYRHVEIMHQFDPQIIITTLELLQNLSVAEIDAEIVGIENLSHNELESPLAAHELAYVIFTSGSTGQPKGVMIPRTALSHYTEWAITEMQISKGDRWSQHPNIAFDLSVLDIYGALCGGATLYPVISKKDKLLPATFIKRNKLTIWNSVPSVIDLMIKARQLTKKNLSSLRLLTFCGEPLYPRHLHAIFSAHRGVKVHNTYGPTEATVSCTLIGLTADSYTRCCDSSVALGHPIPGMEFKLIGGDSREGELVLLGEQLALGYWKNGSETEKAFTSISIGGEDRRAYRTGDWVVKRGGEYYFSGRIDSQVKIRGHRVELDEIDSTISALGFGNSCTVFVNDQLHSFIETGQSPEYLEFKSALSTRLPDYEIPAYIHTIENLPVSSNDKIDRLVLKNTIEVDNESP